MNRLILRWPLLAALVLALPVLSALSAPRVFAQATSSGTIVGVVSDQSGALIPGAIITLTDPSTKTSRTTTSNKDGSYVMVDVIPGMYNITATKKGFSITQIDGQNVNVGSQTNASFKMAIGAETTVVEVQSSSADLQTMNASIGDTVTPAQIDSLPAVGRDVSTFATLQPGVAPSGAVAGTDSDQAVFQLDGGNNSSDMDGSMLSYTGAFGGNPTGISGLGAGASGVMPMPQDSVEEFKVTTTGQTADFNNSVGSQTEVVTKRGHDQFHATAYEFYLDSNIGANTWSNNLTHTVKPSYHFNRFGGAAGGPILPRFLGGKTYLFGNYEGYQFPNSATFERAVPTAAMRSGLITQNGTQFDLTSGPNSIDPRGLGIDPVVQTYWNKYLPLPNDASCGSISTTFCDGINEQGWKGNVGIPLKSNFGVARLDHDFGEKWHFNMSYRYYRLTQLTTNQVDIGGALPGDTLGKAVATDKRPQQPFYFVAGLTTNITANLTNDFHYSYLLNYWSWSDSEAPPAAQGTGLAGAIEPFGENNNQSLTSFNIDSQDIRERIWDGHDHFLRDDATLLKGNHLFQFGGQYQHNYNFHNRTDNGGGINYTLTYQLGDTNGAGLVQLNGLSAKGYPSGIAPGAAAAAVLGIVTDAQVAYIRAGSNLALQAPGVPAFDKVTIPYYNVYASDTWHIKPSLTINYGIGWALEMPPTEATGKQIALVDSSDEPIHTADYLAQRKAAALQGAVYEPELGFAEPGNVGAGLKHLFNPFYGGFAPRLSAAWNPGFGTEGFLGKLFGGSSTVIRAGYGRSYSRLNGVGLVLTPLLGTGVIQGVQCRVALSTGACGPATPTDSTAFRIGAQRDGTTAPIQVGAATLPQPLFPGYNGVSTANSQVIDPTYRPNDVDSFNLTIQRQVNRKMLIEVGYIGRLIHHEFQEIGINTVPYMMVQGGQSFANAYAAIETAMNCTVSAGACAKTLATATAATGKAFPTVSAQPFFETALAGTGYCNTYANCTTAVLQKEIANLAQQKVFSLWSDLDTGGVLGTGGFNFGRSLTGTPIPGSAFGASGQLTSGVSLVNDTGYSNYHAGFVSFKATDYHGLTLTENFTYGKALGTGVLAQAASQNTPNDAFDLHKNYGVQTFQQKFIFNTFLVYQTPWFKEQSGIVGRLAGGWSLAPIFTAGSGVPIKCTTLSGSQSFGGADNANFSDNENCVFTSKYNGGYQTHRGVTGGTDPNGIKVGTAVAGTGPAAINMFASPTAVYDQVRDPILGVDNANPGNGPIYGLPYWNMDMSIKKNMKVFGKANLEFSGIITNILNHNDFSNPKFSLASTTGFGTVTTQGNLPRQIQMGIRASY